jgi:hypothetical protein
VYNTVFWFEINTGIGMVCSLGSGGDADALTRLFTLGWNAEYSRDALDTVFAGYPKPAGYPNMVLFGMLSLVWFGMLNHVWFG